jgi:hypothetical protein
VIALLSATVILAAPSQGSPKTPAGPVVTDPALVNVCERVPGADVAKAFGLALRSQKPVVYKDSGISRCVYILGPADKPTATTSGLVLWLSTAKEYAELNKVTEAKLEPVSGLGDEAVRFLDSGDGRHKIRVLRKGRFSLEATAADAASAQALAKLALERFDR